MNAANGWQVRFAAMGPGGAGGVEVVTDKGRMRMAPEGLAAVIAPVVGTGDAADTVTYVEVWPGVDVRYTVTSVAVKEDIVVRRTPDRSEFAFVVDGVDLRDQGARQDLAVEGPFGQDVAIAHPEVVDRSGRLIDRQAKPDYLVEDLGRGQDRLVVRVDEAWAKGLKAASLPVVIDPTVTVSANQLTSYRTDGTNLSDGKVRVGNPDTPTPTLWRTVARYPFQSAIQGKQLLSATLNLNRDAGTTSAYGINVWWASAWSYAGTTGNGNIAYVPGITNSAAINLTSFYAARQAAGQWTAALGITGNEGSAYTYKRFDSSVTFVTNTLPAMAQPAAPSDGAVFTTSTTPRLAVNPVTDPDGNTVLYWFRLSTGPDAESGMVVNSGWLNSTPSWTVPAGVLQDGVTYYWHTYVWDFNAPGVTVEPTWVRKLTIDQRLGAGGTSATEQVGPVTVNLGNGNAALSTGTHRVQSLGGEIGLDFTYNSQGSNQGLSGSYFRDDGDRVFEPTDPLVLERRDTQINFAWGNGAPAPSVPVDGFLARWKGFINLPATLTGVCDPCAWELGERSDDGFRLKIDGSTIINNWTNGGATAAPTSYTSVTSGPHAIEVEYYDSTSIALVELWARDTSSGQAFQVPASWLSVTPPGLPDGWTLSTEAATSDWASARVNDASVTLVAVDGSTVEFVQRGTTGAGYLPPAGYDDILTVNTDGGVTVTGEDGTVAVFGPTGELQSVTTTADGRRTAATERTFNAAGQLTKLTDPVSGRDVTVTYAPSGTCPTAAPDGSTSAPVPGMICRVDFFDGETSALHYTNGRLAWVVNPGGETTGFGYDSSGRVVEVLDSLAADAVAAGVRVGDATVRTQITHNGSRVASIQLPAPTAGALRPTTSFAYSQTFTPANNPNGQLVSGTATVTVAGQSGTRQIAYDGRGRVTADTDPTGRTTTYLWDNDDRVVATTGPDGLRSTTIFDPQGRPIEEYGPAPAAWFGNDNKPTSTHLANTPVSTTGYDEGLQGLAASWWDNPDLAGAPKVFEQLGDTAAGLNFDWGTGGPAGLGATDNFSGRLTGEISFTNNVPYTFRIYRNDRARLYIDDQLVIDGWAAGVGNTAEGTVPAGVGWHRIRLEYAELANTAQLRLEWKSGTGSFATVPANRIRPRYGLATTSTDDEGQTTTTSYNDPANGIAPQLGLATAVTNDPSGLALTEFTSYENPGSSGTYLRRVGRTLPAGGTTTYEYYGPTETTDDPCTSGTQTIPQAGLLRRSTDPDPDGPGGDDPIVREQVHDPSGRVIASRVLGDAGWTCTRHDARGRVTEVAHPAFGGEPARTVAHNKAVGGNPLVTSVTDPAGTITTTVDLLGRVVNHVDVWGVTTAVVYDQAGRMTSQVSPAGSFAYGYDGGGQLTSVTRDGLTLAEGLTYDNGGRLTAVTYPAGTGKGGNATTGTFSYDTYGRAETTTWTGPLSTVLTSDAVTRTRGGRVVGQVVDGADHHAGNDYHYDTVGRLTEAWVPGRHITYAFAPSGGCGPNPGAGKNTNRTSMTVDGGTALTYCYDHADRLTSTTENGVGTISYDSHGNTADTFGETRTYDSADRHLATSDGTTAVRYLRDATDRIVERSVNGVPVARYGHTASGDISGLTLDTTGELVEVVVALPGGALQTINETEALWSYPNIHGDLVTSADLMGTKRGVTAVYDPYGNVVTGAVPDNSTGSFDYGWLGQHQRPLEHESGLQSIIEMGARQYSPLLGRFLETDPVEGGSCSDYDYVCSEPVNKVDLDGNFQYTLNFDLGRTRLSASQYMSKVAANFGRVFPIAGRPAKLPRQGANVNLRVGPVPFPVYVSRRSAAGWAFGTRVGHPDHKGWVSFEFTKSRSGHMNLRVRGYVPDYALGACSFSPACWLFRKRLYRAVAVRTWSPFAANLRAQRW